MSCCALVLEFGLLGCGLLCGSLFGSGFFSSGFFSGGLLGSSLFGSHLLSSGLFGSRLLSSGPFGSRLFCSRLFSSLLLESRLFGSGLLGGRLFSSLLLEGGLGLSLKFGPLRGNLPCTLISLLRGSILHKHPAAAELHLDRMSAALAVMLTNRRGFTARHGDLARASRSALLAKAVKETPLVGFLDHTVHVAHLDRCRTQLAQQCLRRDMQFLGKLGNCCCHSSDLLLAPGISSKRL